MNNNINKESNLNKSSFKWLVIIRVILGLSLFIKGIQFIYDKSLIRQVFTESLILQDYYWLQTLIPWLNLLGGVFIILGLFTRLAVLLELPILIGAVIFVHSTKGIYEGESELVFSIFILVLLIVFLFVGGGPLSWDKYIKRK
jgi:uncharacterized membrane protein YphA (DoxX/SURF4 family)